MKHVKRLMALALCTVMALTGTASYADRGREAVFSISGTMSGQSLVSAAAAELSDPYYDKQWALYNDGTFTYESGDKTSDGTSGNITNPYEQFPGFLSFPGGNSRGGRNNFSIPGGTQRKAFLGKSVSLGEVSLSTASLFGGYYQTNTITAVADIDIDAKEAWDTLSDDGDEVIIAVIDTGVDYTHEDLKDSVWTNTSEIAGDGIDNDKNGYIDDVYGWDFYNDKAFEVGKNTSEYEHGTHVAGIMAASLNSKGIAGAVGDANVKVMSIKVLGGKDGSGEAEDVIAAIEYAEKMGASICNLSFGTQEYSAKLYETIKASDMLFVCAAGNGSRTSYGDNTDNIPCYPASFNLDNIISVANLTYDGTLDASSNYGKTSVDIAAPGSYIISTLPNDSYGYFSGTSMAAPYVSAVAALVYSDREVELSKVKEIILGSVQKLDSLKNKVVSGGMVNAYNALTANISGTN